MDPILVLPKVDMPVLIVKLSRGRTSDDTPYPRPFLEVVVNFC